MIKYLYLTGILLNKFCSKTNINTTIKIKNKKIYSHNSYFRIKGSNGTKVKNIFQQYSDGVVYLNLLNDNNTSKSINVPIESNITGSIDYIHYKNKVIISFIDEEISKNYNINYNVQSYQPIIKLDKESTYRVMIYSFFTFVDLIYDKFNKNKNFTNNNIIYYDYIENLFSYKDFIFYINKINENFNNKLLYINSNHIENIDKIIETPEAILNYI